MNIDRVGQRCANDDEKMEQSVGRCVVSYIEEKHNCTSHQLMANKSRAFCDGKTMPRVVKTLTGGWPDGLDAMSGDDISNLTGCLPRCKGRSNSIAEPKFGFDSDILRRVLSERNA